MEIFPYERDTTDPSTQSKPTTTTTTTITTTDNDNDDNKNHKFSLCKRV